VTRKGGWVAAYVWDYAGRMEWLRYFWDAAFAVNPEAEAYDEGKRFPICHPDNLTRLFTHAGLDRVESTPIDVPTHFDHFEDYWRPFLSGQFPAPQYVASLTEDQRAALREMLQKRLPTNRDGSIDLMARAWAVCGTVRDHVSR
ncbi:MAG: SAM-dependent methyltransferase, partial [Anaerolineae bacterium]|nr:SAM-dependent methyltransferase [Anaerolineae bacterium]